MSELPLQDFSRNMQTSPPYLPPEIEPPCQNLITTASTEQQKELYQLQKSIKMIQVNIHNLKLIIRDRERTDSHMGTSYTCEKCRDSNIWSCISCPSFILLLFSMLFGAIFGPIIVY
ncbi:hypothetical protein DFJ63DRAFT_315030 [Scheffersomyces coipomensis]|uniref:uncharacterized protein n=1 Tax=Scheffersomyces coipomensis TaxID=1788519 RepID=UPI00315CDAAB